MKNESQGNQLYKFNVAAVERLTIKEAPVAPPGG